MYCAHSQREVTWVSILPGLTYSIVIIAHDGHPRVLHGSVNVVRRPGHRRSESPSLWGAQSWLLQCVRVVCVSEHPPEKREAACQLVLALFGRDWAIGETLTLHRAKLNPEK